MNKYRVGDVVRHDHSIEQIGTVTEVREHEKYTTFVNWDSSPERNDWYDPSVLLPVRVSGSAPDNGNNVFTLAGIDLPNGRPLSERGVIGKAPTPDMKNGPHNL